jgi:glycosyltransferase involved in cell wall biosynthesis
MFRKSKKILFAINNLTYGGIQTQAVALAHEFQKKGFKVFFLSTSRYETDFVKNELLARNIKIINGSFINSNYWSKFSFRLNRCITIIKAIFLLRYYRVNYVIPYQRKLSYFFGAIHPYTGASKTIFHIRDAVSESKVKSNWYLRKAMENKPCVVTNSNHARLKFQKLYGNKYKFNLRTIYNGISIREIDSNINWKNFFGLTDIEFVAVAIANFYTEKDYDTLFKAWKVFCDANITKPILVVAGDEGLDGYRAKYELIVKNLGINENVKFLGRSPYNIELLKIANIKILSSISEGQPNVVIETLGVGTAFTGTNIDGIKEVLGDGYPIPLFEIGNYIKLSEILINFQKNKYQVDIIKNYSSKRFQIFSIENLINNYLDVLSPKKL